MQKVFSKYCRRIGVATKPTMVADALPQRPPAFAVAGGDAARSSGRDVAEYVDAGGLYFHFW